MLRSRTLRLTLGSLIASLALGLAVVVPNAAAEVDRYERDRDDMILKPAYPFVYAAGAILDWIVYRPFHYLGEAITEADRNAAADPEDRLEMKMKAR